MDRTSGDVVSRLAFMCARRLIGDRNDVHGIGMGIELCISTGRGSLVEWTGNTGGEAL